MRDDMYDEVLEYLAGRMTPRQKQQFELRLKTEPELGQLLEDMKDISAHVDDGMWRSLRKPVHELAHEFLHHTGEKLSKTQKETEAEAVAYVVCQSIGLDTNTAFSDYIQLYRGEKETLISSIQRIKDVSGRILDGLT